MKQEMSRRTRVRPGKAYRICPLCEKAFSRPRLEVHIKAEPANMRRQIVKAIRNRWPAWTISDGACGRCWAAVRDVVRVRDFMKRFKGAKQP